MRTVWIVSWGIAVGLCVAHAAAADSIKVGDKLYDNVLVSEGASSYYVSTPEDGKVLNVPKSDAAPGSIVKLKDKEQRDALYRRWEENAHGRNSPVSDSAPLAAPAEKVLQLEPPVSKTEVKGRRPVYLTAEQRQAEQLRKQQNLAIDDQRRNMQGAKYRALMKRKVYTSKDAPNRGMGGGGYGRGMMGGGMGGGYSGLGNFNGYSMGMGW